MTPESRAGAVMRRTAWAVAAVYLGLLCTIAVLAFRHVL